MTHKHYYSKGYKDAATSGKAMPAWGMIKSVPAPSLAAYTQGYQDGREYRYQLDDIRRRECHNNWYQYQLRKHSQA